MLFLQIRVSLESNYFSYQTDSNLIWQDSINLRRSIEFVLSLIDQILMQQFWRKHDQFWIMTNKNSISLRGDDRLAVGHNLTTVQTTGIQKTANSREQ